MTFGPTMKEEHWFAAQVRSNHEKVVEAVLTAKNIEAYVPSSRDRRQWSDRAKEIIRPLFPGYVFCHMEAERRALVEMTPGVVQIVGAGRRPIPIEEAEMEGIRSLAASGARLEPCPYLAVGDDVVIRGGPLNGVTGTLQAFKTGQKLVISISLLRRSVAVDMQDEWVVISTPAGHINAREMVSAVRAVESGE